MNQPEPLRSLEEWESFVEDVYPEPDKPMSEYRNYDSPQRATVREFYRLNHRYQSLEFALDKRREFTQRHRMELPVWEAFEFLDTLVDDSDPDTELSQLQHLMQTSEAIRADGHPDWFVLTGLIHDLGKVLCLFGEPQWAVVGDTFPVGCRFSDRIVYAEYFVENPDWNREELQTQYGIYTPGCGLDSVVMSWGHDEYLYHVVKDYLPEPALYMIRYHSFYAQHRERAYDHLLSAHDQAMFDWVRKFNPYDLYSKSPEPPRVAELRPYYESLIAKYLPPRLRL